MVKKRIWEVAGTSTFELKTFNCDRYPQNLKYVEYQCMLFFFMIFKIQNWMLLHE